MKRVLLTGATGFIGWQTLPFLLDREYEVHAIASHQLGGDAPSEVHFHQANLLDKSSIRPLVEKIQPTHLLHLAWYAVPGKFWSATENLLWLQASLELLHVFQSCHGHRVVIAGTCAEYDWDYGYCSEAITPLNPATVYGVCKHALQTVLSKFGAEHGLSSAWGRIFFLYGPRENRNRLVSSVINSLLNGEIAECGNGQQIRDFLHVIDVASALVAILDSDVKGPVNIGSGIAVSVKDLVTDIAKKIGREELLSLGARPTPRIDPPFLLPDVLKLRNEVKWTERFTLDEGVSQTIAWWKKHNNEINQL